jgi:hypothetical protein
LSQSYGAPARQQFRGKWTLTGANSVICFWHLAGIVALSVSDKDVALATAPVNVTHPNLVRRLAWDIPLKNI